MSSLTCPRWCSCCIDGFIYITHVSPMVCSFITSQSTYIQLYRAFFNQCSHGASTLTCIVLIGILLVQDSHFCYLFLGDTASYETGLSFWVDYFTPVHESSWNKHFTKINASCLSKEWGDTRVWRRLDCEWHMRCTYDTHSHSARTSVVGWKNSVI